MTTEEMVQKIINDQEVVITSVKQMREVSQRLKEIKKNCKNVLSQIKNFF